MILDEALSFNDVAMVPQYSNVESRENVNLKMNLECRDGTKYSFILPIISSPMSTVTEGKMAAAMARKGGLGIIHRFNSLAEQVYQVDKAFDLIDDTWAKERYQVGAAIGVNGDYKERCQALIKAGAQIICIDIAYGNSIVMKNALKEIVNITPKHIHIMASSVADGSGFRNLISWGADSVRVSIGAGANCETSIRTGHGLPTFASVLDCYDLNKDLVDSGRYGLIADGGIIYPGDLVKSFGAGATMCMLGSTLSSTDECPGEILEENGKRYKFHRGSASAENQKLLGVKNPKVEGMEAKVPYKGSVIPILESIKDGLKSGCSYSGVSKLSDLAKVAVFRKITNSGFEGAKPHILNRI